MKKIRLLLLGAFISGTYLVCSAANLGWGVATFSKDTLYLGETLIINTSLINYDTTAFNDSVSFSLKINGVINVNPNIFPNPFPVQPINIPAGDSLPATLSIFITPAYFQVGPDILVVWPKVNGSSAAHDSITKTIIVLDPTVGLSDQKENKLEAFYFDEKVFIRSEAPELSLNLVRIYNLIGEEILSEPLNGNNSIPFNNQPKGIYFVEVNFNATGKRILKIVNF